MTRTIRFTLISILSAFLLSSACAAEPLRLATSKSGWLIWLAQERGAFEDAGVAVTVEAAASGVAASAGLIEGRYDLATMSEFAFVARSFEHADLRLIATVAAIDNIHLVTRRDRAIASPADLAGRTIGLRKSAISEFFLNRLLALSNVAEDSVTVRDFSPPDLPAALADGSVDGIVSWEPYADRARKAMDGAVNDFTLQGGQLYYFVLATRSGLLESRLDEVARLLDALVKTTAWVYANEEEARAEIARILDIDPAVVAATWERNIMDVTLPQDLLFLMEEEADWRLRQGLNPAPQPDLLKRIDPAPLLRAAPNNVTLAR